MLQVMPVATYLPTITKKKGAMSDNNSSSSDSSSSNNHELQQEEEEVSSKRFGKTRLEVNRTGKNKGGRPRKSSGDAHNIPIQLLISKNEEDEALEIADELDYTTKSEFWRQLLLIGIKTVKQQRDNRIKRKNDDNKV